jgi:tetratricopeptide (TPR) repeat protein
MAEPIVAARPKKTGPMPDFEAAAADLKIEQAFVDPPPPNRDELLDTARIRYQRALQADAKHKGALLGLARMHARLDEQDRALEAYRTYFEHYPKDADIHHEVALRLGQWKNWAGVVSWCEAALKLDPENRTYRKTMGFALAMGGRWEEAFTTLSQIMPEAQARHNLAGLLDHLGHRDACRQQLEMALAADPVFAPSRDFLAELNGRVQPAAGAEGQDGGSVRPAGGANP